MINRNLRNYQPVGNPFRTGADTTGLQGRPGLANEAFPEQQVPSSAAEQNRGILAGARDIAERDLTGGGGLNIPGAPTDFSIPPRIDTSPLQAFVDRRPPPMPNKPSRPQLFAPPDRINPLDLNGRDGPGAMPDLRRRPGIGLPPPRRM